MSTLSLSKCASPWLSTHSTTKQNIQKGNKQSEPEVNLHRRERGAGGERRRTGGKGVIGRHLLSILVLHVLLQNDIDSQEPRHPPFTGFERKGILKTRQECGKGLNGTTYSAVSKAVLSILASPILLIMRTFLGLSIHLKPQVLTNIKSQRRRRRSVCEANFPNGNQS